MSGKEQYWLKLHRKIIHSTVFDNPNLLKTWIWCLCKAQHSRHEQIVGRQLVTLERGQFVFGRFSAAEELKMNSRTVYDYIKLLEKFGNISIKSNNKFSVITIENWELYQGKEKENQHQTQHQNQHQTQHQMNTNKNAKNDSNNDSKNEREKDIPPSPGDEGWIDWAWGKIKGVYPRKDGAEAAKPQFLKLMEKTKIEDRDSVAHRLFNAVILYRIDYDKTRKDDAGIYTFVRSFSRWFNEDFDEWMKNAEEYEKERAEAEQSQKPEEHNGEE